MEVIETIYRGYADDIEAHVFECVHENLIICFEYTPKFLGEIDTTHWLWKLNDTYLVIDNIGEFNIWMGGR